MHMATLQHAQHATPAPHQHQQHLFHYSSSQQTQILTALHYSLSFTHLSLASHIHFRNKRSSSYPTHGYATTRCNKQRQHQHQHQQYQHQHNLGISTFCRTALLPYQPTSILISNQPFIPTVNPLRRQLYLLLQFRNASLTKRRHSHLIHCCITVPFPPIISHLFPLR